MRIKYYKGLTNASSQAFIGMRPFMIFKHYKIKMAKAEVILTIK